MNSATALEEQVTPPQTLILRGAPGVLAHCRPQGEAVAYLCQGGRCSAPITTLDGLLGALSGQS